MKSGKNSLKVAYIQPSIELRRLKLVGYLLSFPDDRGLNMEHWRTYIDSKMLKHKRETCLCAN